MSKKRRYEESNLPMADAQETATTTLVGMGFSRESAQEALEKSGGDVQKALDWLMEQQAQAPLDYGSAADVDGDLQRAITASLETQSMREEDASAFDTDVYEVQYSPEQMVRTDKTLPVGLRNVGNTCYVNTFLQLFFNVPVLRELVLLPDIQTETPFVDSLQLTFARMQFAETLFVDPRCVLTAMKDSAGKVYKIGAQEDATEFNTRFLACFEAEAGEGASKRIAQLLEGTTSEEYAVGDRSVAQGEDTFRSLVLAVDPSSRTLHDLLERHTMQETIDNYKYKGSADEELVGTAEKRVWFATLPPVLTFQLQRAAFEDGVVKKNSQAVKCPRTLLMDRYMKRNAEASIEVRTGLQATKAKLQEAERMLTEMQNVRGTGKAMSDLLSIVGEEMRQLGSGIVHGLDVAQTVEGFGRWKDQLREEMQSLRNTVDEATHSVNTAYNSIPVTEDSRYELCGVLMHDGELALTGHYWACLFNPTDEQWYTYNDTSVTRASEEILERVTGEAPSDTASSSSAYCLVYVRAGCNRSFSPTKYYEDLRLARLREQVERENAEHVEALRKWEADISAMRTLLQSGEATRPPPFVGGFATDPVLDGRLVSRVTFAGCKHEAGGPVMKVLPVSEAYHQHFNADLLMDWQSKKYSPRADRVSRDAGISELLYKARNSVTAICTAHDLYAKVAAKYHSVLAATTSGGGNEDSFSKLQGTVWSYIADRERLEECWKDQDRHNTLLLEFCVRWTDAIAEVAKESFNGENVLAPVGHMSRLALELPQSMRTPLESHVVDTISTACGPILAQVVPRSSLLKEFQAGRNPPKATGTIPTPKRDELRRLAEDILMLETKLLASLHPKTRELRRC